MNAEALFTRVAGASVRRPRTVVAVAALLSGLALTLAATVLELRTSNLDLVDPELPAVADFRAFALEFGTPNVLVVVLEGEQQSALREAVDRLDPLLAEVPGTRGVLGRLPWNPLALAAAGVEPYFLSRDRRMAFLFVRPDDPTSRADTIAPFVTGVRQVLDETDLAALGVRAGLTGMPQYALDDRDVVQRDLSRLSWWSLALVVAIYAVGFRAVRGPAAAVLSMLTGVALTLGAVALYPGHLTLLSAFFATILFGVGGDYGIHMVGRVEEMVREGQTLAEAIPRALGSLAPSLLTSAVTTALAFLSMVLCGFRGFAELGIIAATGIVLCFSVTVTVLPAILMLLAPRPRRLGATAGTGTGRWLLALGRPGIAGLLGVAALAGLALGSPGFDRDYLALQTADSEAVRLEREMVRRSDLSPEFAAFVVDSREDARHMTERLRAEPTVARVQSVLDLDLLSALGGRPPSPELLAGFVSSDGRFAVYAYPAGDVWDNDFGERFAERMRAIDEHVTGIPILGSFMVERSRRALLIGGTLGGAVLLVCLLVDFRRPLPALLAVLPTFLTVPAMLGAMKLLGMQFNPLNVMALPVVFGIAVDNGVHVVHRFYVERGRLDRTLAGTGRSVALTAATTLAAFGSLAFATHRGLASFGLVVSLGVSAAVVLALLVLPPLLAALAPRLLPADEHRTADGGSRIASAVEVA